MTAPEPTDPEQQQCEAVHPSSGLRCVEPASHRSRSSHGDGSIIRWLTPDQRASR